MKYVLSIALLLTLSACGSTANNTATTSATTNTAAVASAEENKPKKNKICRSEKSLGSNMKAKACRPKS